VYSQSNTADGELCFMTLTGPGDGMKLTPFLSYAVRLDGPDGKVLTMAILAFAGLALI
jgi:hypothetical protein